MLLTYHEAPKSFISIALVEGCKLGLYNNKDNCIVSALKGVARLVWQVFVGLLLAPFGMVYHLSKAVLCEACAFKGTPVEKEKNALLAWEHLKAAIYDLRGITQLHHFFLSPASAVPGLVSSTYVIGENGELPAKSVKCKVDESNPRRGFEYYHFHVNSAQRLDVIAKDIIDPRKSKILFAKDKPPFALQWRAVYDPTLQPEPGEKGDGSPDYTFPWAAAALVVTFLALVAFGVYVTQEFDILLSGYQALAASAFGVALPFLFFAKWSYIQNRGKAEVAYACKVQSAKETEYWLGKAILRGDTPAQYKYGEWCLRSSFDAKDLKEGEVDEDLWEEGWKWIHQAAANGSEKAMELLNEIDMRKIRLPDGTADNRLIDGRDINSLQAKLGMISS